MITAARLDVIARRLDGDIRDLIPCKHGTKQPLAGGFNQPGYATDWKRWLQEGDLNANLAMVFGGHGQFFALDCDSRAAVDRVSDLLSFNSHVRTSRGAVLLMKSPEPVASVTGSTVINLQLNREAAGELRLQKCYSLIEGLHPSGVQYQLFAKGGTHSISVKDFVATLKMRGFEMPDFALSADVVKGTKENRGRSSSAGFWCKTAEYLAETAPARADQTVATHQFVLQMTSSLRVRPDIAGATVSAFIEGVARRGLRVRGGESRLLAELQGELTRWAQSYGQRAIHRELKAYIQTPDIFAKYLSKLKLRRDYLPFVWLVADAFVRRARETGNPWCYESVRALDGVVDPAKLSRVFQRLVDCGLLEREENDLPTTRPKAATAQWKYRCNDAVMPGPGTEKATTE